MYQEEKRLVRAYIKEMEQISADNVSSVIDKYMGEGFNFKGSYPYRAKGETRGECIDFWQDLKYAFGDKVQRRIDIFFAGDNVIKREGIKEGDDKWVLSMGHFLGNFDKPWHGISPTGKLTSLRFAEFYRVKNGKIIENTMLFDLISVMRQAGQNPLPPETGNWFMYPGPRHHNGLLYEDADPKATQKSIGILNAFVELYVECAEKFKSMGKEPPIEELRKVYARDWAEDMIWYGPAGIGASHTIPRYQHQHQIPFRHCLGDHEFYGHVCRIAEGDFVAWFGWPNLANRNVGGYLGMPESPKVTNWSVFDIYSMHEGKISENWMLPDLPQYLKDQGLDILERNKYINNPDFIEKV